MSVIPNGVAIRPESKRLDRGAARDALGLPAGAWPVIVSIGRLATQKGYRYLLEACALLLRDVPHLQLLLAGEGESCAELEVLSRDLRIDHCTHMLGHRSDVRPVLDAADYFVLPSLWEAMPFALLEAMASVFPWWQPMSQAPQNSYRLIGPVYWCRRKMRPPWLTACATPHGVARSRSTPWVSGQARIGARFSMASMLSSTFGLYRNLLSGKERSKSTTTTEPVRSGHPECRVNGRRTCWPGRRFVRHDVKRGPVVRLFVNAGIEGGEGSLQ